MDGPPAAGVVGQRDRFVDEAAAAVVDDDASVVVVEVVAAAAAAVMLSPALACNDSARDLVYNGD